MYTVYSIFIHVFKTCKCYKSVPPPGAVGAAPPAKAAPRAHPTWEPTVRNNGKKQRFFNPKLLSHEAKRDNWFNCLRNCFKDFFWNNLTHLTKKASDLQMVKRVSTVTVQPENRFFSSGSSKLSISARAHSSQLHTPVPLAHHTSHKNSKNTFFLKKNQNFKNKF